MVNETLLETLREIVGAQAVRRDVPMSGLTTFQIGGPAAVVVEPASVQEAADVLAACQQEVRDLLGSREMHEPRLVGGPPQVRADLAARDRARHGLDVTGRDDLLDVRRKGLAQAHADHSPL